jgi:hypothetical protein
LLPGIVLKPGLELVVEPVLPPEEKLSFELLLLPLFSLLLLLLLLFELLLPPLLSLLLLLLLLLSLLLPVGVLVAVGVGVGVPGVSVGVTVSGVP